MTTIVIPVITTAIMKTGTTTTAAAVGPPAAVKYTMTSFDTADYTELCNREKRCFLHTCKVHMFYNIIS